jgi:hypothetical protein
MEYFGWETPFGGVFVKTPIKQISAALVLVAELLSRDASFELLMTKFGPAVLKLLDNI